MRKRIFVLLLVVLMTALSSISTMAAEVSFTDISGHWAEKAIVAVAEKGLFKGTSETTFSPDLSMDRGMFVTVLGRFAEKMGAEVNGTAAFADVSQEDYFASYVAWAAEQGIVKGTSETTFSPTQPVTREQMCTLFVRLLNYAKYTLPSQEGVTDFADQSQISDYAQSTVMSATALGLIKGIETPDGIAFCPQDSATRAQVATVFLRLDGLEGIYELLKPVDPAPVTPSPSGQGTVTPTPPSDATSEDINEEAKIASYMVNILQTYEEMEYMRTTDKDVQECMGMIMNCVRDSLNARNQGVFLSKEYINKTYSNQITQAKNQYKSMNDQQKSQMDNIYVRFNTKELRSVLSYFGFGGLI